MADNDSYIKLYRKITEWEWYSDINVRIVFIHLLLTANWKDKNWHGIVVKRGQKVTSFGNLAAETGLTTQQIRTAINRLKSTCEITCQSTNRYTLITLENYSFYQENPKGATSKSTSKPTNGQQTTNKQLTTTKERKKERRKEEKEINKEKVQYAEFVFLSTEEHEKLLAKYGISDTERLIEILDNYKGSSGKKYANDYRAILNWCVKRLAEEKMRTTAKGGNISKLAKLAEKYEQEDELEQSGNDKNNDVLTITFSDDAESI